MSGIKNMTAMLILYIKPQVIGTLESTVLNGSLESFHALGVVMCGFNPSRSVMLVFFSLLHQKKTNSGITTVFFNELKSSENCSLVCIKHLTFYKVVLTLVLEDFISTARHVRSSVESKRRTPNTK